MPHDEPDAGIEDAAARLRLVGDDLSLYAGFLLNVLADALPGDLVQVRRERGWRLRREPAVLGVSATLGNLRFEISRERVGAVPAAVIRHQSGGVVLSTRAVGLDTWARELATALAGLAERDARAAEALRRLTT